MTNFLHKAGGALPDGGFWSVGLKSTGAISEAAAETAWHAAWTAFWGAAGVQALFPTGMTMTSISTSTASATWRQTTATRDVVAFAGTAITQELPSHDTMVVTSYSALATKFGHGRFFFPAPVAAALAIGTGGTLSAGSGATLSAAFKLWYQALVAAGLTGLLETGKPTVTGAAQYSTRLITTWNMQKQLHVQKRRSDKIIGARFAIYP